MSFPLFFDEDVDVLLAELLTQDGYDVVTTRQQGRDNQEIADPEQLTHAASEGRALFTHNVADFWQIAQEWADAEREHSGIILSPQRPPHELRQRFPALFERYPGGMKNLCDFL